jgi:hypothetical protein
LFIPTTSRPHPGLSTTTGEPTKSRSRGWSIDSGWLEPETARSGVSDTMLSPRPAASLKSSPVFFPPSKAFPVTTKSRSRAWLKALPPQPQIPPPPPCSAGTASQLDTALVVVSTEITLPMNGPASQYDPVAA